MGCCGSHQQRPPTKEDHKFVDTGIQDEYQNMGQQAYKTGKGMKRLLVGGLAVLLIVGMFAMYLV